jgi:hypothetical protein
MAETAPLVEVVIEAMWISFPQATEDSTHDEVLRHDDIAMQEDDAVAVTALHEMYANAVDFDELTGGRVSLFRSPGAT